MLERVPVRAIALAAALGWASPAFATGVSVYYDAIAFAAGASPVYHKTQTFLALGNVEHSESVPFTTVGGIDFVGSLDAHAAPGSLGAGADGTVHANSFRSGGKFDVTVMATLADTFTYTDANLALGTPVDMHATLNLSGGIITEYTNEFSQFYPPHNDYTQGGGVAWVKVYGSGIPAGPYYGGQYFGYSQHAGSQSGIFAVDDVAPATLTYSLFLKVGEPTPISITLEVGGEASADNSDSVHGQSGSGKFIVDFQRTLTWGGITSVTDAAGSVITGGTLTAESGFDYSKAVPEPGAGELLISALVLVGGMAAGRRSSENAEPEG